MGLSSKQVSSSGINWNQTLLQDQTLEIPKPPLIRKLQQQQNQPQPQPQQSSTSSSEPLKCPRCDSINTKFCYYNNYNKSQPRHFCRTCKRHWTKGGTLRNVPVGGGRKNKRVKKSTPVATSSAAGGAQNQTPLQRQSTLSLPPSSASLYQALIRPPPPAPSQSLNLMGNSGNGSFLSSSLPLVHQNQNFLFPFSSSSSFETNNPSCSVSISTSLRSSNAVYNSTSYGGGELKTTMEETTTTPVQHGQPWEIPPTSVGVGGNNLEMSSYWSWEDIDSLVSTDLNVPWDDSDLKP